MKKAILYREKFNDKCILGTLIFDGFTCVTLELPDKENQRDISCILEGDYICKKIVSPKFGLVFQILNVSCRSNVLFHVGNYPNDTHGCILVGLSWGGNNKFITDSRAALDIMTNFLKKEKGFKLKITGEKRP